MECRELAPVLSRVGFVLQYRKDRLTSPLSIMPGLDELQLSSEKQAHQKKFGCLTLLNFSDNRVKTEGLIDIL